MSAPRGMDSDWGHDSGAVEPLRFHDEPAAPNKSPHGPSDAVPDAVLLASSAASSVRAHANEVSG